MHRAVSIILALALALSAMIAAPTRAAAGGIWYVALDGNDANSCNSPSAPCATIARPLGKAGFAPGDTIRVAAGVYETSVATCQMGCAGVRLWQSANLSGGWDRSFSYQYAQSVIGGPDTRNGIGLVLEANRIATVERFKVNNWHYQGDVECYPSPPTGIVLFGGGVYNGGTLTLVDSEITNNAVWGAGGGIANAGTLRLDRSAVTANRVETLCEWLGSDVRGLGGGIYNTGTLIINNSTVAGNSADDGGGIYSTGLLSINSATVVGNTAAHGGGIYTTSGTAQNSIIAHNLKSATDCQGTLTSSGYNLFSNPGFGAPTCQLSPGPGDRDGVPVVAGPLGNYGGLTSSVPLLPGSPAINGANPSGCADDLGKPLSADQRGVPRTGRCDVGAYEANLYVTKNASSRFRPGDPVYFTISLSNLDGSSALEGATLEDALPSGLTYVDSSLSVTDGQAAVTENKLTWSGVVLPDRPVALNFAATIDSELRPGDALVNTAEGRWNAALVSATARMLVASEAGTPTPTPPASCPYTPTPRPTFSGTVPVTGSIQQRVAHCADDAHERADTSETFYGLNNVTTGGGPGGNTGLIRYAGGFLFRDVRIPRNARITSARLTIGAQFQSGLPVAQIIAGDNRGDSEDFTAYHLDINARPRTASRVPWNLAANVFNWTDSPDITAVVQEIVDRGDWQAGNDMAILIDGGAGTDKYATWWARELGPSKGAQLSVSYNGVNTPTPTATVAPTETPSPTATPSLTATPSGTPTATRMPGLYLPVILR